MEVGENIIDAVKREIMEETGIEVGVGELFQFQKNFIMAVIPFARHTLF